jgi:hypothetical protein
MLSVLRLALGVAIPVLAFAQGSVQTSLSPSVGVYMDFDSAPGVASLETMKKEVNQLLQPSGISLNWRLTKENRGDEAFSGLVVIQFRGKCKAEGWWQPATGFGGTGADGSSVLASTRVDDGKVTPYSEVQCDQVRRALSYLSPEAGQEERQSAFGRALARVVAHEIYHILARTTAHAAGGLAKASHSLEDLISAQALDFLERDSEAMRNSFQH